MPKKSDKSNNKKEVLIKALENSLGVVTTACKNAGVARTTFYDWTNPDSQRYDKDFHEKVIELDNVALDFVENQLFQKIQGVKTVLPDGKTVYKKEPDTTAIIFYLKTKGKERGFIERKEHDHTTKGKELQAPRQVIFKNMDDESTE